MFNIFNPELVKHQKLEKIRTENELRCIEIDRKLHKRMFDSFVRRKYYDRFKKLQIYEQYQQNLMNEKKQIKCYQSYGFHFRRDGKGRHYFVRGGRNNARAALSGRGEALNDAQKYEENLTFHCIEDILFTGDEIDIDKIIALYLITVQDNLSLMTSDFITAALSSGTLRRTSTKNLCSRRSKYVSLNNDKTATINENESYIAPRAGDINKSPRYDKSTALTRDRLLLLSSEQECKKETKLGCGELILNDIGDDNDETRSSRRSIGVASTMARGKIRRNILEKWFTSFPVIYILEVQKHANSSKSNSIQGNSIQETTKTVNPQSDTKRLIVNIKLIKLLNTVIASLQHGNPKKLEEILNRLQSQMQLKEMLKTQKISYFLRMLETKQFMLRPESYFVIDNIKNPIVYLQIDQYHPSLEKFILDKKESSGSETHRRSDSIKGSNWKLNLSTSQLSVQHKASNNIIDPTDSLHLLTATDSKLGGTSGGSIAEYLSKRLRSNLQKHESEMRKLKQLKETVSDEILFNEKYFKLHLPPVIPLRKYDLEDETTTQVPYYNALMNRDVQIVARPFTIRQSSCYACLNKFRRDRAVPKIPTLIASKPSNWFESAQTNANYYNCPSDVLFLNNNISHQSTDAVNRILTSYIHDTEKSFEIFGGKPVLTTIKKSCENASPPKTTLKDGKVTADGTSPTLDTSSVADDEVYFFPTQSVYSDQTFFRNSAWPLKLLNDNELYTMVFKDVNLKKLEERIAKIEIKKRLDNFLNSP